MRICGTFRKSCIRKRWPWDKEPSQKLLLKYQRYSLSHRYLKCTHLHRSMRPHQPSSSLNMRHTPYHHVQSRNLIPLVISRLGNLHIPTNICIHPPPKPPRARRCHHRNLPDKDSHSFHRNLCLRLHLTQPCHRHRTQHRSFHRHPPRLRTRHVPLVCAQVGQVFLHAHEHSAVHSPLRRSGQK